MIAFKGFNSDLACTMGDGTYQYKIGSTYTENTARCAGCGFHCVEEPIEVLRWYGGAGDRYCMVEAAGDIHEDGEGRIACTELTVLKEVSLPELGILECRWILEHPGRENSRKVHRDAWAGDSSDRIVVVRGRNPKAAGRTGTVLFLVREAPGGQKIVQVGVYEIDGEEFLPGVYYRADGRRCRG